MSDQVAVRAGTPAWVAGFSIQDLQGIDFEPCNSGYITYYQKLNRDDLAKAS
jgi:hypothetical protein